MSGFSMFYALLPQPLPLIILCFFVSLSLAVSFVLPEGGRFLQAVNKISVSVTQIDISNVDAYQLNESIALRLPGHGLMFNETYREHKGGVSRPRLNDSSLDPDLLFGLTLRDKSILLDKWRDNSNSRLDRSAVSFDKSFNKQKTQDKWSKPS